MALLACSVAGGLVGSTLSGDGGAFAAMDDAVPPSTAALADRTLSAVAYLARDASHGGGSLTRLMFQAYLRPNGSALVRVWDVATDAYTAPAESRWTVSGDKLCLGLPPAVPRTLCLDVHVWGPRIAGASAAPYAMLDGDLKQGNLITAGSH